ncbi:gamma-aminobutyric acid type B receptor subunit 2-like [Ylistrum balloti]|uniref:gamma-aminobutyric acid type B receptor subunit 2-like n=1 Tax=Ylistrum balloti TaxID=509963 RepID=UPI00290585EF|nr:gamma-aminobutyric acid type B receptor subunit 2-like [Ylistrum balloti]
MALKPEDVRTLTFGTFVVSCFAATIGFIFSTVFLTFNVYHRKKRFMKMSSPKMNVLISAGGLILNCTCMLYGIEYFFHHLYSKTTVICQMRLWLVTFGITMLFSPMFVKSWRVYQIFKNAGVKRVVIRDRKLLLAIMSMLIIDAVLLSLWQGVDPPISHPVTIAIQSSGDMRRNLSAFYTYVYVQECNSGKTEVWVSLMLVWKTTVMAVGLFLAWKTKHIMLPAMRDSACIVISVLVTMFLTSHTLMLTSSLRHIPDAVYIINILLTTIVASLVQSAVFLPKVRFYWKTSLEQQMRMSLSTHEINPHLATSTGNDFEEELVQLVAANDTLKKCLTQKNSMIQILEGHLRNAKVKLTRMTSEREVKVDSGLDMSSSSFPDDDVRQSPDGQIAKTPATVVKVNNPARMERSETILATPDQPLQHQKRANSDFTNHRVTRKRPLKRDRECNTWNRQKQLQSFPTQELDCLRDEIDADLTHAHMLSTSLRASISNELQKMTTNNTWYYDSMKSRQDVVGSVARSYDLEDNSDTYSYVSSYVPCKIPRRKLDYNSIPSPSLDYSCDSLSTTLANDKLYPDSGQDGDDVKQSRTFPPSDAITTSRSKIIPCKLQFNKYLVTEVDNGNKSYYL